MRLFDSELFRIWQESYLPEGANEDPSQSPDELDPTGALQEYLDTEDGTDRPGIAIELGDDFYIVAHTVEGSTYGTVYYIPTYRVYPRDYFDAFLAAIDGGGGGLDCKELRECLIDKIEETPTIAEEELPRNDEDFLIWRYLPPTDYNELLQEPIEIPYRRNADIVAILQVMQWQLNEIITVQRSETTGAAFPEHQQIRIENNRPVGLFQCCELYPDGRLSGAHYTIQIPWLINDDDLFPPQVYWYRAGNWQALRLFPDNSRMIIYVENKPEGERVLNAFTDLMEQEKKIDYVDKYTEIVPPKFKKHWKIPKYLSYYGKGDKRARPDWSKLVLDANAYQFPPNFNPVPQ